MKREYLVGVLDEEDAARRSEKNVLHSLPTDVPYAAR